MIKTQVTPRWENEVYNVEIEPKVSIRLHGLFKNVHGDPRPYDITFKIGDKAEYDSYNLKYVGTIVNIGEKTVTIQHRNEKSRLDLAHFANRNWDFDFEKIQAYNNEESQYI